MKNKGLIALVLSGAVLSGCAFNPQQASLNPTLNISESQVGSNTKVAVKVIDERADKSLGRRGTAYGDAAEITAKQDLTTVVKEEIEKGLAKQGFIIGETEGADSLLTVEIRALEYSTSQGFWTGGVHIKGAFKGRAKNADSDMEKMYRYEKEERVVVVPTAETNEKWINEALTETLSKLITDGELLSFLSAK